MLQWPFTRPRALAVKAEPPKPTRKSQIDAVLTKFPGVVAKKIGGLDAYFVNDRMFACINGNGLGLRLPVAMPSSREWIQIEREDAADYDKDLELFQASLDFVKAARGR